MWGCENRGRCGENCGRVHGVNVETVGKCVEVWGEVRGNLKRSVRYCWGKSGKVCWRVGREVSGNIGRSAFGSGGR